MKLPKCKLKAIGKILVLIALMAFLAKHFFHWDIYEHTDHLKSSNKDIYIFFYGYEPSHYRFILYFPIIWADSLACGNEYVLVDHDTKRYIDKCIVRRGWVSFP